jgi:Amidohydrolase family
MRQNRSGGRCGKCNRRPIRRIPAALEWCVAETRSRQVISQYSNDQSTLEPDLVCRSRTKPHTAYLRSSVSGVAQRGGWQRACHIGLPRKAVLRAITMNSSYELHQDDATGSIEVGKLADLIVLDRNFFTIPAEQIADIKVVQTIVGGRTVYDAGSPAGGRQSARALGRGRPLGASAC